MTSRYKRWPLAAATADLPRQHSPYGERVMRLCVYQVVTLRKSASEVAAGLGNHPCPKTIQGWVRDSLQTGGDIIAPTGRLGIRHEKRKADDWAKTCLEILVHDHESHSFADFALSMRDMTGVGPWSEMMISRALHVSSFLHANWNSWTIRTGRYPATSPYIFQYLCCLLQNA